MIKTLLLLMTICSSIAIHSQNLVINPSFEAYINPSKDIYYAKDWEAPNNSSIDYYTDLCPLNPEYISFNQPCVNISNSILGYHPPYDGDAYIGLVLISWDGIFEHYTGQLTTPLVKDSIYDVILSIRYGGDICWLYCKTLEAVFTNKRLSLESEDYLYSFAGKNSLTADLRFDIRETNETRKWLTCHTKYKARGGERYMTIGIFKQQNDKKFIQLINRNRRILTDYEKLKNFVNSHESDLICLNPYSKKYKKDIDQLVTAYYLIDLVLVSPESKYNQDYTISVDE